MRTVAGPQRDGIAWHQRAFARPERDDIAWQQRTFARPQRDRIARQRPTLTSGYFAANPSLLRCTPLSR